MSALTLTRPTTEASQPETTDEANCLALPPPCELLNAIPATPALRRTVQEGRSAIRRVLSGEDSRLLVVVGPCSAHDPEAVLEYANRLSSLSRTLSDRLLIVLRAYIEKPRTTVGWRGLLYDPYLDGSFDMAAGLTVARRLFADVNELGLPVATEALDPAAPAYLYDLVSFAAIGARTVESQPHRALASGLGLPVGFKNGTDGAIQVAVDAMVSSRDRHSYIGMDATGRVSLVCTPGNPDTALVLRGGKAGGPNYGADAVADAVKRLQASEVNPRLIVDCSHANSGYDPRRQIAVSESVARQRQEGAPIVGVMLESHLFTGKQSLTADRSALRYGVSVTDGCLGWPETADLLENLAHSMS